MFARRLEKKARENGISDFKAEAISFKMVQNYIQRYDLVLVGPQMKFKEPNIANLCAEHGLHYLVIEPQELAEMRVEPLLESILNIINKPESANNKVESSESQTIDQISMNLISRAGVARSHAMESIRYARIGEIEKANEMLKKSETEILECNHIHDVLIVKEANNHGLELSLLLMHALENLVNATTVRDLAEEFVRFYQNRKGDGC